LPSKRAIAAASSLQTVYDLAAKRRVGLRFNCKNLTSKCAGLRFTCNRQMASGHFRGVTLHPPPDGHVVDQKSAISKEFLPRHGTKATSANTNPRPGESPPVQIAPLEKTTNRGCEEHRPSLSGQASKLATLLAVVRAPPAESVPPLCSIFTSLVRQNRSISVPPLRRA
jgi:hypothetical protein